MKRAIIVGVRESKDKETGDDLLFISCFRLPSKMKNGGLWFPKQTEAVLYACINKARSPEDYESLRKVLPGAVCDVTLGVNDFNGQTFVAKVDIVKKSDYTPDMLYI